MLSAPWTACSAWGSLQLALKQSVILHALNGSYHVTNVYSRQALAERMVSSVLDMPVQRLHVSGMRLCLHVMLAGKQAPQSGTAALKQSGRMHACLDMTAEAAAHPDA